MTNKITKKRSHTKKQFQIEQLEILKQRLVTNVEERIQDNTLDYLIKRIGKELKNETADY